MKEKSHKNPVLTSPWKIGVLVALLLVVVGFGAGYYVIETYNIELQWLTGGLGEWEIDSFGFFREVFPLVAGLIILSMISYFAISSAVRRYRHYLDSGQDYRQMIQLAESIDDLTSPAQIAKLRNYPELQSVLRSYGDQIRGISEQLREQQEQEDNRSVDLEMEIDTLLQGEVSQDSLVEDRWWTPLYRKIEEHITANRQELSQMKLKLHDGKSALGQVALSTGRIVEQIGGTGDDYPEIMNAVNELTSLAKQIDREGEEVEQGQSHKGVMKAIVSEMENTLHKLEEGGKVLNEFSEENNGLALNIALMAAKGEAEEHELAQFAEKVRLSADRFNKLSKTFSSMAQSLLGTCYSLKEKLGVAPGGESSNFAEVKRSITSISRVIEERCNQLKDRFSYIGSEIHDVQELVNKSVKSMSEEEVAADVKQDESAYDESDDDLVIERSGQDSDDSEKEEELVVDHGSVWDAESQISEDLVSFEKPESDGFSLADMKENFDPDGKGMEQPEDEEVLETAEDSEAEEAPVMEEPEVEEAPAMKEEPEAEEVSAMEEEPEAEEAPAMEEEPEVEEAPATEEVQDAGTGDEVVSSVEEIKQSGEDLEETVYDIPIDAAEDVLSDAVAAAEEAVADASSQEDDSGDATEAAGSEEDWLGKADKHWFKIDIDKGQEAEDTGPEEISVRETEEVVVDEPSGVGDKADAVPDSTEQPADSDDEDDPIYDLFELGAIEYVEETMTQG